MQYSIRKSKRAKYMRLSVYPSGTVVLTVPEQVAVSAAEEFLQEKMEWVRRKIAQIGQWQSVRPSALPAPSERDYRRQKWEALKLVRSKVAYFSEFYGVRPAQIGIRNTKTRWGSCSKNGRLNFNYRLVYAPSTLVDYVVAHEVCHLQELNHSPRFWTLLAQTIPEYRERRQELRRL